MMRLVRALSRLTAGLLVLALATGTMAAPGDADESAGDAALVWDPFEPANRAVFSFNDGLDRWLLEPVATGYDFVMPGVVQTSIGNFFQNLLTPVRLMNDVLQGKPIMLLEDVGRFIVNSSVGVGGLFDPATAGGLPKHTEDFGQTLGYWGMPPGPYLMLPVLGPSNPRDTVGLAVDSAVAVQSFFLSFPVLAGAYVVNTVNSRSQRLEQIAAEREAAFDFYAAVRSAYTQYQIGRAHV